MKNIYLITGASASGKTTVANKLEEVYKLKQVQSYTTRPKRFESEKGHTFVTEDEFNELKDFVGYTEYQGNKYAATTEQVENNDVYVINPDGIEYFKQNYKGNKGYKIIYIKTDALTCSNRMQNRGGMTFDQIMNRITNDLLALKNMDSIADFIIENNDDVTPDITAEVIHKFIKEYEVDSCY